MKALKKYAGLCAALLAIVALVLAMATPGVSSTGNVLGYSGTTKYSGITCIFGSDNVKLTWAGLTAWILLVLGVLALCAAVVGSLLDIKPLKKNSKYVYLCAALLVVVAGILMFFVVAAFKSANGVSNGSLGGFASVKFAIGAGWVIGGILAIAAGVLAAIPVVIKK